MATASPAGHKLVRLVWPHDTAVLWDRVWMQHACVSLDATASPAGHLPVLLAWPHDTAVLWDCVWMQHACMSLDAVCRYSSVFWGTAVDRCPRGAHRRWAVTT